MRRVCSECHVVYGVKCKDCGNEVLQYLGDDQYYCEPCNRSFPSNDGPDTHGYCRQHAPTPDGAGHAREGLPA